MGVEYRGSTGTIVRFVVGSALWLLLCAGGQVNAQEAGAEPEDSVAQSGAGQSQSRLMISSGLGGGDLALSYPDLAVWLETSDGDKGVALLEVERRAPAEGAVLVLGGEGQPAASALPGALLSRLAEHGWATMVLGLPQAPQGGDGGAGKAPGGSENEGAAAGVNVDPNADDSVMIDVAAEPESPTRKPDYRERIRALLAAGVVELGARGYQRIVLVGVGMAALPVMQAAMSGGGEPLELVWVSPRFSDSERNAWPASLEGVEQWPILDLTNALVDPQPAEDRAAVFRRLGMAGYQQQRVPLETPVSGQDAPVVVNRILAWLARGNSGVSAYAP